MPVTTAIQVNDIVCLSSNDRFDLLPRRPVSESGKEPFRAISGMDPASIDKCWGGAPSTQRVTGSMQMPGKRSARVT